MTAVTMPALPLASRFPGIEAYGAAGDETGARIEAYWAPEPVISLSGDEPMPASVPAGGLVIRSGGAPDGTATPIEGTDLCVHLEPLSPDPVPFVSVVVPTRNRGTRLAETLDSVARQIYPADRFELLVLDNGSTDRTPEVAAAVAAEHGDRAIRHVFEPMPGLLSGRHRGVQEARGPIVTFADDDVLAHPLWLAHIAEGFRDPEVHCVGGRALPLYQAEPPAWMEAFWESHRGERWSIYLSLVDLGDEPKPIDPHFVFGLNFSIRKDTFLELGGTHPDCIPKPLQRYQGDGETGLALRLIERGYKTAYEPGARVWHVIDPDRMTVEAWESRQFYQGVCDSFTQLRANGGEPKGPFEVKRLRGKYRRAEDPDGIRLRLEHAQRSGFAWHQREVRDDAALRAWVVRPDYLDYSLPDGWRAYMDEPA